MLDKLFLLPCHRWLRCCCLNAVPAVFAPSLSGQKKEQFFRFYDRPVLDFPFFLCHSDHLQLSNGRRLNTNQTIDHPYKANLPAVFFHWQYLLFELSLPIRQRDFL